MEQEFSQTEENLNRIDLQNKEVQQDTQVQYAEEQNSGTAREQLNLEEEKERISFLLKGYVKEINEKGERVWVAPENDEMVILSEYGIRLILNTMEWYLNKNTLLSNYDDDTIRHKMEDFSDTLNDAIFMKYDKIFKYPSLEDCKDVLKDRIQRKIDVRTFALELMGKEVSKQDKKTIEEKMLKEIEPVIEKEIEKIKQQLMKDKLKRFELLVREVQDSIHSAYNRAYKGEERKTLRQHHHISETKSPAIPQRMGNGMSWFKRR